MIVARRPGLAVVLLASVLSSGCGTSAESTTPTDSGAAKPERGDRVTRVRGRLLGHDGQPLALAQIEATVLGQASSAVVVGPDGGFTLELPGPGWARLRLTGVDHADHYLEFLADGGEHELEVRLGTYARPDPQESVRGFGRFDGEGERVNISFVRGEDGRYVAKFARGQTGAKAKEFHYQISDATAEGRTINGTQADRYVYDGGGDYFSVVALGDADELEIGWDPQAMPPSGRELELKFADPESSVARSALLYEQLAVERMAALRAARAEGDPEQAFARADARLREQLSEAITHETDPLRQRMLWVAWADTLARNPSEAERAALAEQVAQALSVVGPRDPVWSLREWAMALALVHVDDPQYFALAAAEHPDPTVGAALWLTVLMNADEARDLERAREAGKALGDPRFAELEILRLAQMFDPNRPTAPGRQVPDFRVVAIDGKTEFSPATLHGKTYVLDFWATWCGPCLAEMPRLHAAYATLNGQGPVEGRHYQPVAEPKLELISISFDHDVRIVEQFRTDQWPMPWSHAVPDEAAHKRLSEQFGLAGIPTMVLVGPDGTILASSPRLDGSNLGEIAGKLLGQ